jgi:hypothetical protein
MEARRKHDGVNMWFTDEICSICNMPIYTDGKTEWCGKGCKRNQPGTYAGLQEDYMR